MNELDPLIDQLRAERVRVGLTQRQLADLVGTTQSAISEFERGICGPTLRTFRKLAKAFGYDVRLVSDSRSGAS